MLKEKISEKLPEILLGALIFSLLILNYDLGTLMSGWDNVHAEFHGLLNIKRAFMSVWQEYQSFGLLSGMAHSTTLIHSLVTWFLTFILPLSFVRYFLHFVMLGIGAFGVNRLFGHIFKKNYYRWWGFLGALFYLLSFYTVQVMSLPMEGFTAFFAFLPWELYLFIKFLEVDKDEAKVWGLRLLLLNFFGMLQFLTQTLFIVYMFVLLGFGLDYVSRVTNPKKVFRLIASFFIIVFANSFWLLPQIYFLYSNRAVLANSKINQMATDAIVSRSAEVGNITSLVQQKSLYTDLLNSSGSLVFEPWLNYLSHPLLQVLMFLTLAIALVGLISKRRGHFGFILALTLSLVALAGESIPLSYLNDVFRSNSFLNQVFRSPFTKFSTVYVLTYSYLFVSGLMFFGEKVRFRKLYTFLFGLVLVITMSVPSFRGNHLSDLMRVNFPDDYFVMMGYINEKLPSDSRVALLPDSSFWGWFKYKWGYEGSGFWWYGLETPVVSRTFDVWSFNSESFYWELNQALETFDYKLLERVLDKYDVSHVILDRTLIPITPSLREIRYEDLDQVLRDSTKLTRIVSFGNLGLYKFRDSSSVTTDFISVSSELPSVGPEVSVTNLDVGYGEYGNYVVSEKPDAYYPFADLMTQTDVYGKKWRIEDHEESFQLVVDLTSITGQNYELSLPEESLLTGKVFLGNAVEVIDQNVNVRTTGNFLYVNIPKELLQRFDLSNTSIQNCGNPDGSIEHSFQGPSLTLRSKNKGIACFGYELPLLAHWNGYLIDLVSRNISGNDLYFYILGSKDEEYAKLEALLGEGSYHFLLSPGYFYNDGYVFSFQNVSYGKSEVVNTLERLRVYLFPYEYLKEIKLIKRGFEEAAPVEYSKTAEVTKKALFWYEISNISSPNITLWQSYDPGWVAICDGKICPAEHVLVNNWANGWVFENADIPASVEIVFWPQFLQYLGYFIALGTLFFLIIPTKNKD